MPNTGDSFITTLLQAHLEWGEHRHNNSRGIVIGEGYLQIPAEFAYQFDITKAPKPNFRPSLKTFSTASFE